MSHDLEVMCKCQSEQVEELQERKFSSSFDTPLVANIIQELPGCGQI